MHDESLPSRKKQREFVKACVEAGVVDHKVRSLAFFLILQHHYRNTSLKELTKAVLKLGLDSRGMALGRIINRIVNRITN